MDVFTARNGCLNPSHTPTPGDVSSRVPKPRVTFPEGERVGILHRVKANCASTSTGSTVPAPRLALLCQHLDWLYSASTSTGSTVPAPRLALLCQHLDWLYSASTSTGSTVPAPRLALQCQHLDWLYCASTSSGSTVPVPRVALQCQHFDSPYCATLSALENCCANSSKQNVLLVTVCAMDDKSCHSRLYTLAEWTSYLCIRGDPQREEEAAPEGTGIGK